MGSAAWGALNRPKVTVGEGCRISMVGKGAYVLTVAHYNVHTGRERSIAGHEPHEFWGLGGSTIYSSFVTAMGSGGWGGVG